MLSRRIRPATALSIIAILIALEAPTYAANYINGALLKPRSVTGAKIKPKSITGSNIANGTLGMTKLDAATKRAILAVPALGGDKITDGSVGSADVADGSVGTVDLADGSITGAKLAAGAVTAPGGVLPSGRTMRGSFGSMQGGQSATEALHTGAVTSFQWELPTKPIIEIKIIDEAPTPNCPGSAADPQAAPGYLCLYVAQRYANCDTLAVYDTSALITGTNFASRNIFPGAAQTNGSENHVASKWGFMSKCSDDAAGVINTTMYWGTWAATA